MECLKENPLFLFPVQTVVKMQEGMQRFHVQNQQVQCRCGAFDCLSNNDESAPLPSAERLQKDDDSHLPSW